MDRLIYQTGTVSQTYEGNLHPDARIISEEENGRDYDIQAHSVDMEYPVHDEEINSSPGYVDQGPVSPPNDNSNDSSINSSKISTKIILLGVGALAIIGVAIYFIMKK